MPTLLAGRGRGGSAGVPEPDGAVRLDRPAALAQSPDRAAVAGGAVLPEHIEQDLRSDAGRSTSCSIMSTSPTPTSTASSSGPTVAPHRAWRGRRPADHAAAGARPARSSRSSPHSSGPIRSRPPPRWVGSELPERRNPAGRVHPRYRPVLRAAAADRGGGADRWRARGGGCGLSGPVPQPAGLARHPRRLGGAGLGAVLAIFPVVAGARHPAARLLVRLATVGLVCWSPPRCAGASRSSCWCWRACVGALAGSLISLLKVLADPYDQLPAITFWLLGSLARIKLRGLGDPCRSWRSAWCRCTFCAGA